MTSKATPFESGQLVRSVRKPANVYLVRRVYGARCTVEVVKPQLCRGMRFANQPLAWFEAAPPDAAFIQPEPVVDGTHTTWPARESPFPTAHAARQAQLQPLIDAMRAAEKAVALEPSPHLAMYAAACLRAVEGGA